MLGYLPLNGSAINDLDEIVLRVKFGILTIVVRKASSTNVGKGENSSIVEKDGNVVNVTELESQTDVVAEET